MNTPAPVYKVSRCAIAILAAGSSSRLGRPKQLLTYNGKSLVRRVAEMALQTSLQPVMVLVGAHAGEIKKELAGMDVEIIDNSAWEEGMASSVRLSLSVIHGAYPAVDGVIFMVCDQPFVTPQVLQNLLETQHRTGLPVVASRYENRNGTPALWHKAFFNELMQLKGDTGAKKLLVQLEQQVATVPFPEGKIDIDTLADYERLQEK